MESKQKSNSYIAIAIFTGLIGDSFVKALFENTGISTPNLFMCNMANTRSGDKISLYKINSN